MHTLLSTLLSFCVFPHVPCGCTVPSAGHQAAGVRLLHNSLLLYSSAYAKRRTAKLNMCGAWPLPGRVQGAAWPACIADRQKWGLCSVGSHPLRSA